MTKLVIASGGTGGHLFPALEVAKACLDKQWHVGFVTDQRGIQYQGRATKLEWHVVDSGGVSGLSMVNKIISALKHVRGFLTSRRLLKKIRPKVVVGFGGYASFPVLAAARWLGIPIILHEQNAILGLVNRCFVKKAYAMLCGFPLQTVYPMTTTILCGNPVRSEFSLGGFRGGDVPVNDDQWTLLVLGGSQGAKVFSDIIPLAVTSLPENDRSRIRVIQQCRKEDLERVLSIYTHARIEHEVSCFFENIPELMQKANLIVSRAGASTTTEILISNKPALFVPYPYAAGNHQHYNAESVAQAGAGMLVPQDQLTPDHFRQILLKCMHNPDMLRDMAEKTKLLAKVDAVQNIIKIIESKIILSEDEVQREIAAS